jgi:bifunctional UDP-N-acetylglucosamine pyrophosphorylase/glucosamine-1-phosphate N-acetyltransferase
LRLTFFTNDQNITPLLEGSECNGFAAACLKVMDKPLLAHNIDALNRALRDKVTDVAIPKDLKSAFDIMNERYRNINVDEVDDSRNESISYSGVIDWSEDSIRLPINSVVHSLPADMDGDNNNIKVDLISYPWNFLTAIQSLLRENITNTFISPTAKVSKTSVIEGPCIIEDNVVLDDFCKIKGPAYISTGSTVGMCSLIRSSVLGKNTKIGFNCEIAKSFFSGDTKMPHQNEILDSLIGKNVWFGGYSATANVLLTKENVKFQIDGSLVDTGTDHFGAIVGNNSAVGANVLILPGRQIPPNSRIQAGTIVGKKIADTQERSLPLLNASS